MLKNHSLEIPHEHDDLLERQIDDLDYTANITYHPPSLFMWPDTPLFHFSLSLFSSWCLSFSEQQTKKEDTSADMQRQRDSVSHPNPTKKDQEKKNTQQEREREIEERVINK